MADGPTATFPGSLVLFGAGEGEGVVERRWVGSVGDSGGEVFCGLSDNYEAYQAELEPLYSQSMRQSLSQTVDVPAESSR